MKAVRFVIPKTSGNSFHSQVDEGPHFYDTIHYHPEHQLTLIVKGEGTSFIGNHVDRFQPGDIFVIGKNVPHVMKCDHAYYQNNEDLDVMGISIFFKDETFGSQFFELPEMAHIKVMLQHAAMGLKFIGKTADKVSLAQQIKNVKEQKAFDKFMGLLQLLNTLSHSDSLKTLSTVPFTTPSKDLENERINVVFNFLSNEFRRDISLDEISSVANMTPNAFCRYFKQRTGKTYTEFLNEMRVEYASKLLIGSNDSLANIAFDSGFNSVSYFNRQFKKLTSYAPLQYRQNQGQVSE